MEEQNRWFKSENKRLEAMLNAAQDHLANLDGEPLEKKRRKEVPITEKGLDQEEAIQQRGGEDSKC